MSPPEKLKNKFAHRFWAASAFAYKFASCAVVALYVGTSVLNLGMVWLTGHTMLELGEQGVSLDQVVDLSTWNSAIAFLCQFSVFLGLSATLVAYALDSTKWSAAWAAMSFALCCWGFSPVVPVVAFVALAGGVVLGVLLNRHSRRHHATHDHGSRFAYVSCRCGVWLALSVLLVILGPAPEYSLWVVLPIWILKQCVLFSGAFVWLWERAPAAIEMQHVRQALRA